MNNRENELAAIINAMGDYDEVSDALIELKNVNRSRAKGSCLDILVNKLGDRHLQAFSFEILYSVDKACAIQYIDENFENSDPVLMRSMFECVTVDSSFVNDDTSLLRIVKYLKRMAADLKPNELAEIGDTLEWFNSSYKGV